MWNPFPPPPRASRRSPFTTLRHVLFACGLLLALAPAGARAQLQFESPLVHPLEWTPSRHRLLALHAADQRLVVFDPSTGTPVRIAEIPVGMDPVTVRARNDDEVWVVDHLSDAISIVDLPTGRVVDTVVVGDEPTDVVFAGSPERAFVCLSQEDRLLVLDPDQPHLPGTSLPLAVSDPRALAVSPDRGTVYVAVFESGNQTTIVPTDVVDALGGPPAPDPPMAAGLPPAPRTGLIVRYDGFAWRDETGGDWSSSIGFDLVDDDVLAVDANGLGIVRTWTGLGTHLFGLAVDPSDGELFVSAQEALNEIRFEPKLRGRFARSRIARLDPSGSATLSDLNPHIAPGQDPNTPADETQSVSLPADVVVRMDGSAVFVASFGSSRVVELDGAGGVRRVLDVGAGPCGLALDETLDRLYVLERFESELAWIDLPSGPVQRTSLGFDPTPADVKQGRAIFYDAANSAHGDLSCATCHLFGGMDNLAWDLGNPQGSMTPPPPLPDPPGNLPDFHPMKGPMTTQSLKALTDTEPLHWRGDRAALSDFNAAFESLLGAPQRLSTADFALFESFVRSLAYPPNPFRDLDGSLPASVAGGNPSIGEQGFLSAGLVLGAQCADCHAAPAGETGIIIAGNLLLEDEGKVVPQLRNLYEKTGFDRNATTSVRGFGFTHDGAVDDLVEFLQFPAFAFDDDQERRDVAAFLLCFETGTPAALGARWTATGVSDPAGEARLSLLQTQADAARIDLIAKGRSAGGQDRGWWYQGAGNWRSDKSAEPLLDTTQLLALAGPGTEITFTAVEAGQGQRMGIERDGDGYLDGDERDAGSDPGDPGSYPGHVTGLGPGLAAADWGLWIEGPQPASTRTTVALRLPAAGRATLDVHDLRGRRIRRLFAGAGGERRLAWDLKDTGGQTVSSGVYLLRLSDGSRALSRKLVVVR